jgi:hypothetical protein
MNNDEHRKRHAELHEALDELFADYMLHNKGTRPSTSTVIELMRWSSTQCNNPKGKHPAAAAEGGVSFGALLVELCGGNTLKRVGPNPLPGRGDFNPEDKWDTVTIPPYSNMYDCSKGGKCQFERGLEPDFSSALRCAKCGCTPEEKVKNEK